jgi:hypothetical protein
MNRDEGDKAFEKRLEEILHASKNPTASRNALALLFPKAEKVLKTYASSSVAEGKGDAKRAKRIMDPDSAAMYFKLDPLNASWSKSEIAALLSSAPRELFELADKKISESSEAGRPKLRRHLLEILTGIFDEKRPFNVEWLEAIVAASSPLIRAVDPDSPSLFEITNTDRLRWVTLEGLKVMDPAGRTDAFLKVIPEAVDVSLLSDMMRSILGDLRPDGAKAARDVSISFDDRAEDVRQALLARVRAIDGMREVWAQADPREVVWFWWGSGEESETREFADREMKTLQGLVGLIRVVLGKTVSSSEGVFDSINESAASRLLNLERLKERVDEAVTKEIDSNSRALLLRFQKAKKRSR